MGVEGGEGKNGRERGLREECIEKWWLDMSRVELGR